ncbi:restriction endonuclease subunit S [Bacillus altitudinis]|uniref:restriction endonuclease subunit S n=1 Tax=Bacillus altitudinis TaxID=293387 RepID=UPI0024AE086D|nr:restriction endonuclease subunit S [Bacillus altitudinis]MDI6560671.1 restriction endonuclease subunit S [Bacillus altitudinis]
MGSKRVPEVRFNGFSEEWQVCKLFEVAEFNPRSSLPEQFRYVDLGSVVGTNLISYRTELKKTAPSRAQRLAKRGDVFYQMVRPYQKNNFLFDLPYADFVFSTGYAQLRPYGNSYFLLSRLQESRFVSNVLDRSTGTSYPAINSNDLAQIEITVPKKEVEQTQIGNFFKQLDETIAFQQQELDTLKQTKQGLLQKMFPKEGESVPEIRFSGFSGEWERQKFKNLAKVRRGLTYTPISIRQNGVRVLRSSNICDDTFVIGNNDVFVNPKAINIDFVKENDILITAANGSSRLVGKHALIKNVGKDAVHGGFMLVATAKIPLFINAMMSSTWYKKFINVHVSGGNGAIGNLNKNALEEQTVYVPQIEEQKMIGNFFGKLDNTIALQQQELENLKQTKKAFLQKMFV